MSLGGSRVWVIKGLVGWMLGWSKAWVIKGLVGWRLGGSKAWAINGLVGWMLVIVDFCRCFSAVVVVVVAVFPPSPAGSCPSYHFNASSPKMLRGNYGQFSHCIFCQFKKLFRCWSLLKAPKNMKNMSVRLWGWKVVRLWGCKAVRLVGW